MGITDVNLFFSSTQDQRIKFSVCVDLCNFPRHNNHLQCQHTERYFFLCVFFSDGFLCWWSFTTGLKRYEKNERRDWTFDTPRPRHDSDASFMSYVCRLFGLRCIRRSTSMYEYIVPTLGAPTAPYNSFINRWTRPLHL